MVTNPVLKRHIALGVAVKNWEESVIKAGELLVENGIVRADYVIRMVRTVHELGPYIVIAPGLAIPHARPDESVIRSGISIVTLKKPVDFGNKTNDPVSLVIGIAGHNDESHLANMQVIADIFEDEGTIMKIVACQDKQLIADIFNRKRVVI